MVAGFVQSILGDGLPIINSIDEKDILPGGFRMSKVLALPTGERINTTGLDTLKVSGSSQFSEFGLDAIVKRVGTKNVTICNLRQEDGGFLEPAAGKGAMAFSYLMSMPWWTGENPSGNRTAVEIEASEERKMAGIKKGQVITVYGTGDSSAPKDAHEVQYKVDTVVKRALTEKQLATEKGLGYFRIPDKKFGHMEDGHVDDFVDFVKRLPDGEWVHFHCKRGQSRTTLFMVMYDMMRNADRVSADDIIKRQGPAGLGGVDLIKTPQPSNWDYSFKKGWVEFLYTFHTYCKEQKSQGFDASWSDWRQKQGIPTPPPIRTGAFYKETTVKDFLPRPGEVYTGRILALNTLNEDKLRTQNFRCTQDLWQDPSIPCVKDGLNDYYASGSSQYTECSLALMLARLKDSRKQVVVVDLRHDDHLFVDGMNVSPFESKDDLLHPRTPEEIRKAQKVLQEELRRQPAVQAEGIDTKYPKNEYDQRFVLTIKPKSIETPEELVKRLGADYFLVGSKRFSEVSNDDIDAFIEFYRSNSKDTWYHFHCKKGKSRTTLFMTILDMMHNADKVSMQDIVKRQREIGGANLFDVTPKDPTWKEEKASKTQWITFLARFHQYCCENKSPGFQRSWSDWSQERIEFQPAVAHLAYDANERS